MKGTRETGAVAIIPVRVDSRRLPGKALLAESGRELFLHTCEQAVCADCFDRVVVATDDEEVRRAAEGAGFEVVLTSDRPRTGSERCAEAVAGIPCHAVVDIQGDWPEVAPGDLARLVELLASRTGDGTCATLAAPLTDADRVADPNVVKVVRGLGGEALYFSRAPVPYLRDPQRSGPLLRHIGVYGFTRETLLRVPDLPSSGLDECEGLEQLRFLENGIAIHVLDASDEPWGIECRADYDAFLARHRSRQEADGHPERTT